MVMYRYFPADSKYAITLPQSTQAAQYARYNKSLHAEEMPPICEPFPRIVVPFQR